MATSPRTLDQVRSILGKLDRRIDALREARGEAPRPRVSEPALATAPEAPALVNPGDRLIGLPSGSAPQGVPTPAPRFSPANNPPLPTPPAHNPSRSIYGKATPLRP